jgi:hypothetical protein
VPFGIYYQAVSPTGQPNGTVIGWCNTGSANATWIIIKNTDGSQRKVQVQ